jgi:hypothetical protein
MKLRLALCALVAVALGCGEEFSMEADAGGEGGKVSTDAATGSEGGANDASAEAGTGWCATQGPDHTFCEDFSRSVPGKLSPLLAGGGSLTADTTDTVNAPQSMLATTPALAAKGDSASALGWRDFPGANGTIYTLTTSFKIASSCFPTGGQADPVTILALSFPGTPYEIAFAVTPGQVQLIEITAAADGGIGDIQVATFQAADSLLLDTWRPWTLNLNGGLIKGISLTIGSTPVIPVRGLNSKMVPLFLQHPDVYFGATIKNDQGLSPGCKVHVDDILLDVRTAATDGGAATPL